MSQAPCKCRIIEHNDMEASSNFSAPFYVPNPVKCYIAFFSKDTIHQTQKNVPGLFGFFELKRSCWSQHLNILYDYFKSSTCIGF